MQPVSSCRLAQALTLLGALLALSSTVLAGEPDPATYWDVKDVRTGMKGVGKTVMVGTQTEEFQAEVLGVMQDVSPGRDMILCRLSGCNLEHAGIIQGMSGSPIYVDGKLLGAVAFAWEFAKDPIAGVTPFSQMVQYVRANDRRIAAEAESARTIARKVSLNLDLPRPDDAFDLASFQAQAVSGGALAGMRPIATPLAASGFSPRALSLLGELFAPIGLAPMAGGSAQEEILEREGDKPLVPGSPLSIAMVTGDFDLSGIGTVTHVEGDRVYGFGHPMMGLGSCELPLMSGYIHTVYPRASVSMKMGSPLKVIGVIDTDVSTGVAGRVGKKPDMLPMTVTVKSGHYADPHVYHVNIVREPNLLPGLVMSVLTNAIDTEGNLPEALTAKLDATIRLKDHAPITVQDTLSGPRFTGSMGPLMMFGPVSSILNTVLHNPFEPVRVESIECALEIESGQRTAELESIRLASDRVEPGTPLTVYATIKPFKGPRETLTLTLPLPKTLAEGSYEAVVCDLNHTVRRRIANSPQLVEPRDLEAMLDYLRTVAALQRTDLTLHVPLADHGLAVQGQVLPALPGSVQAVFGNDRQTSPSAVRDERIVPIETDWVVEGTKSLKFHVVKDRHLAVEG